MAAMKAMKAMKKKPISAKLARRHVFAGKISKTKTGYTAAAFKKEQGWQDCEQEGQRPGQGRSRPLDCSSPEGPQGFEHQGFCSYQEGHSTLQEGQGALRPVNVFSVSFRTN